MIAQIESVGGKAWISGERYDDGKLTVRFKTLNTDAHLALLKELPEVRSLFINLANITDAGLAHLSGLTELRVLMISESDKITNSGLAQRERRW